MKSFLSHLIDAWTGRRADPAPAPLREAYGRTVDADEEQWRRLTGATDRDLPALTQRRMQDLAAYLWESNTLANRLVELPLAYILAEGVKLTVQDEEAQRWLEAFWHDPITRMDLKLERKVRELALYGEQCWPAFVNQANGHVRLGYLEPALIETVVTDPDNREQPIGIVTVKDARGQARRYRVIVNGPEDVFTERTRAIRQTFDDGDCFFYQVNVLASGSRGRADFLAQMDWLDAYEQYLFGELERGNLLRAFVWDVTMKGATPAEVEERARKIAVPKPGSVRVHNDAEAWQPLAPELGQHDSAVGARLFRNHIMGGQTIPEHWFGGAEDVNRATAAEMGEPVWKLMSRRQRLWKHILEDVGRFVIARRLDPSGKSNFDPAVFEADLMPEALFPELTSRDTTAWAAALQQVVAGTALAIQRGLMTDDTAVRLVEAIAGRLGVEYDAAEELEAARAAAAARREDDVFHEPRDAPAGEEADGEAASGEGLGDDGAGG